MADPKQCRDMRDPELDRDDPICKHNRTQSRCEECAELASVRKEREETADKLYKMAIECGTAQGQLEAVLKDLRKMVRAFGCNMDDAHGLDLTTVLHNKYTARIVELEARVTGLREAAEKYRVAFGSVHLDKAEENRLRAAAGIALDAALQNPTDLPHTRCIVKDCQNHKDQGEFVGDICGACYVHLTSGKVGPTASILRKIRDAELFILHDAAGKIVTHRRWLTSIEWLRRAKELAIRYCAMDGDELSVLAKGIHEFLGE